MMINMSERKRRRLADGLSRLAASVEDMKAIGEDMSELVKRDGDASKPALSLSLRVVGGATSSSAASKKPTTTALKKPATTASSSLLALTSPATLQDTSAEDAKDKQNWRVVLTQLAKEMAATDPNALERCSRLMRRYESLAGSVQLYETKLKQKSNDVTVSDQIESRLEQEEKAWEGEMATREQRIAELEEELQALQSEGGSGPKSDGVAVTTNSGTDNTENDDDADVVMASEVAMMENQQLREALALRMEEKRDMEAAIQSLRRKKRPRTPAAKNNQSSGGGGEEEEDRHPAVTLQLREELLELQGEKQTLEQAILSMEVEQQQVEAEEHGVVTLKAALAHSKTQKQEAQDTLDKHKHLLLRVKNKMKHMVDVQVLRARDTNPPTLTEEIVILHLLYAHAGEMEMNVLKQKTTEMLAQYGKQSSNAVVLRAIYSLVGSLAVHIDRSIGNGVVTSLLV